VEMDYVIVLLELLLIGVPQIQEPDMLPTQPLDLSLVLKLPRSDDLLFIELEVLVPLNIVLWDELGSHLIESEETESHYF
jgi:hypothetical protein